MRSNDRPVTFAVSTAIEAPTLADIAFIRVTEYVRRILPTVSSWRGMSGPWSGIILFARDSALMLRAQWLSGVRTSPFHRIAKEWALGYCRLGLCICGTLTVKAMNVRQFSDNLSKEHFYGKGCRMCSRLFWAKISLQGQPN